LIKSCATLFILPNNITFHPVSPRPTHEIAPKSHYFVDPKLKNRNIFRFLYLFGPLSHPFILPPFLPYHSKSSHNQSNYGRKSSKNYRMLTAPFMAIFLKTFAKTAIQSPILCTFALTVLTLPFLLLSYNPIPTAFFSPSRQPIPPITPPNRLQKPQPRLHKKQKRLLNQLLQIKRSSLLKKPKRLKLLQLKKNLPKLQLQLLLLMLKRRVVVVQPKPMQKKLQLLPHVKH